jgi:hypothetical protein
MGTPIEEVKDYIFKKVESYSGKKQVKVPQLTQEVIEHFGGEANCSKKDFKEALKELIDDEKLVYGYFGGTTIELPHTEGSANV